MIVHVVLFRPRADLVAADRRALVEAFEAAARQIPSVRRARAGRRVVHGRAYEGLMRADYPYAALVEFDDVASLKTYLEHPVHARLAERFFDAFEEALMYDFELTEEGGLAALLAEE